MTAQKMNFNFFKKELERTYRVLDCFNAELQNDTDLCTWFNNKLITKEEQRALKQINSDFFTKYSTDKEFTA